MTRSSTPTLDATPVLPDSHLRSLLREGVSAPEGVEIAVLNLDGVIVAVNQAWTDFCLRNDGDPVTCGVGASYLDACAAAASDESAVEAGMHIRSALAGDLPAPASVLIPCDAPGTARWFDLLVSSRVDVAGETVGAIVSLSRRHVTSWRPLRAVQRTAQSGLVLPGQQVRAMDEALARLIVGAQDLRAWDRKRTLLRETPACVATELEDRVVTPLVELRDRVTCMLGSRHRRIPVSWWPGQVASLDKTIDAARELVAEVRG